MRVLCEQVRSILFRTFMCSFKEGESPKIDLKVEAENGLKK